MSAKKRKRTGRPGKKLEPVTVTNTTHQPKTLMRKIFEREPEDVNGLNEELQDGQRRRSA
jgi:hypothetical protein